MTSFTGSSSPERIASLKAAASSLLSLSFIASVLGSTLGSSDDIPGFGEG